MNTPANTPVPSLLTTPPTRRLLAMLCLSSCVIALGLPHSANATLIAYDDFNTDTGNYVAGSNLNGQSSSSDTYGFTGTWGAINTNNFSAYTISMPLTGITNSGAAVKITSGGSVSRANSRSYTAVSDQSTLWFGSMMRVSANALTSSNQLEMMAGFTSGVGTTTAGSTGEASWSSTNGGQLAGFQWGVSSGNTLFVKYQSDFGGSGSIVSQDTGLVLSSAYPTTYFLVARLEVNYSGADDRLNIWVLTSVPTSESALLAITPTLSVTASILSNSSDMNTALLTASSGATTSGDLYLDTLRAGTTYADLLGTSSIPEPSSTALLVGAGALVFATGISRKRKASK